MLQGLKGVCPAATPLPPFSHHKETACRDLADHSSATCRPRDELARCQRLHILMPGIKTTEHGVRPAQWLVLGIRSQRPASPSSLYSLLRPTFSRGHLPAGCFPFWTSVNRNPDPRCQHNKSHFHVSPGDLLTTQEKSWRSQASTLFLLYFLSSLAPVPSRPHGATRSHTVSYASPHRKSSQETHDSF